MMGKSVSKNKYCFRLTPSGEKCLHEIIFM